tara:strand:+ start:77 stop:517 length:441 start_codon:yes stop_codon:yes gene_type:complete
MEAVQLSILYKERERINMSESNMSIGIHNLKPEIDTQFVKLLQDVTQKVLDGEVNKEKAVRMIFSDTFEQRKNSCYVCHKDIERNEKVAHKWIDPVTDQMISTENWMDGASHIPMRSRHAYHESYTNPELGYSEAENERLRGAFRK